MSIIGGNIDAYCLKCKMTLTHIIVSKVGETISKVKCKTCGAEHKYRLEKPMAKKLTAIKSKSLKETAEKRTTAPKVANNNASKQWDLKNRELDQSALIKDYSIHDKYNVKDVVNHSIFGLGFVERIVTDKSMDVLFCDSVKLMAMNIS